MIKAFKNSIFGRIPRKRYVQKIHGDPLNPDLHFEYALCASRWGRCYLAYAQLKTAAYLGADENEVEKHAPAFRKAPPDPRKLSHNQFFRYKSLASEIVERNEGASPSILDVGGGEGMLASFLPNEAAYCLAEPAINGISGTNLPFPDNSFDFVVSCHVLEHIPLEERHLFLDQLMSKSRSGVILLNPFHVNGTHVDERLRLFIEVTKAPWAKEHLECTLPNVEDIQTYANERGFDIYVKPNGTMATSAAFVFLDFFASRSGKMKDWEKVNAFFNEYYNDILDSAEYPNAYLIYLARRKG